MFKNYITIAWRNLLKNKVFSLINMLGLAISMAAAFILFQYIYNQLSYDRFLPDYQNIYRIQYDKFIEGKSAQSSITCERAVGPVIFNNCPEVSGYTQILGSNFHQLSVENNAFTEEKLYYADSNFFDVFKWPLILGNPSEVLKYTYSLVISEKLADKYFGSEYPLGKSIFVYPAYEYSIDGVFKDFPGNSHFKPDILLTFHDGLRFPPVVFDPWKSSNYYTYILASANIGKKELTEKINSVIDAARKEIDNRTGEKNTYNLQPVHEINLHSDYAGEFEVNNNIKLIRILIIIGILILIMAWINYINLTSVNLIDRSTEMGIRKVNGGNGHSIRNQILIETCLTNLIAVLLAVTLVQLIQPFMENVLQISLGNQLFVNLKIIGIFILFILSGIILSGYLPSLIISARKPQVLLQKNNTGNTKKITARKIFIIIQFTAVACLLAAIITIKQQFRFIGKKDKGLNVSNTLVIKTPKYLRRNDSRMIRGLQHFEESLYKLPI